MRAIDAMFVWTPGNGIWTDQPLTGQIDVTTIPEPPELKRHPKSVGACNHSWRVASASGRREALQSLIQQWIHEHAIPEASVRAVVTQVDEYTDFPFSTAMPPEIGGEDEEE